MMSGEHGPVWGESPGTVVGSPDDDAAPHGGVPGRDGDTTADPSAADQWGIIVYCRLCGRRARARVREAIGATSGDTVAYVARVSRTCMRCAEPSPPPKPPPPERPPPKISTTVYMRRDQLVELKALAAAERRPMADYVRQAVDAVLERYAHLLIDDSGVGE